VCGKRKRKKERRKSLLVVVKEITIIIVIAAEWPGAVVFSQKTQLRQAAQSVAQSSGLAGWLAFYCRRWSLADPVGRLLLLSQLLLPFTFPLFL